MNFGKLFDRAKKAYDDLFEWECEGMPAPEDMTDEDIRSIMAVPTILPASTDRAVSTWLWRLENMWGKLTIVYVDPFTRKRNKITKEQAKEHYMDDSRGKMVGWSFRQINGHSVEMYREFYDERNKIYRESVVVDIDIYPDLRRRIKGDLR